MVCDLNWHNYALSSELERLCKKRSLEELVELVKGIQKSCVADRVMSDPMYDTAEKLIRQIKVRANF